MARVPRRPSIPVFLFLGAALTAAVTALLCSYLEWHAAVSYLAAINASTFLLYGYDKAASRRRLSRVPERTLHLFAFAGGTPAAWLGQRAFRHKTIKGKFRVLFWCIVVLQVLVGLWVVKTVWWE